MMASEVGQTFRHWSERPTRNTDPYERLKRALRAEIDEAAWSALYSTVSRPFDPPKTGKIAVKVINHYGDEVLKVYPIR
jgi:adenine-specific DNA-methyltransferase